MHPGPIGIFDSGYGGLTVFREIAQALPEYDYIYLGDNARAPYGTRSFETIYQYTLEAVKHLFALDCRLVILACNTASARALRSIQQKDLPAYGPRHRVLGVIRPTAERIGEFTRSGNVGLLATPGTVRSESYVLEIAKLHPEIRVFQEACPMWVPLIENNEHRSLGAGFFVNKHLRNLLQPERQIDAILLGCTHYPLMTDTIELYLSNPSIRIISQGPIVAHSLADYLQRHPDMDALCTRGGSRRFLTTDRPEAFDAMAEMFYGTPIASESIAL